MRVVGAAPAEPPPPPPTVAIWLGGPTHPTTPILHPSSTPDQSHWWRGEADASNAHGRIRGVRAWTCHGLARCAPVLALWGVLEGVRNATMAGKYGHHPPCVPGMRGANMIPELYSRPVLSL